MYGVKQLTHFGNTGEQTQEAQRY